MKVLLELRNPTAATTMTWCLGVAITWGLIEKVEKNVKVNCGKYKCCDNMQWPLTVVLHCWTRAKALSLCYWFITCLEQVTFSSYLIEWQMRIWKEVSVQIFEFIFALAYFITSEIFKSPLHFFLPRNSSHACYVTAASFKTRPCFCDRNVLQIESQFALLSFSSSDRFSILLAQDCRSRLFVLLPPHCRTHLSVLLSQHCWILLSASLFFLAQHYYSSGVFVLMLQHCRSHLSVAWPQHSWGLLSVYVTAACLVSPLFVVCFFFKQHYSSHPSVSLVTEEFFQVTCLAVYFIEA
jgi:hypothetical protein